ncbi:MAG: peptidase [Bdellovibrionia bacterium]
MAKKVSVSKSKSRAKTKKSPNDKDLIIIDEAQGLIFENEDAMFGYFNPYIEKLEEYYQKNRTAEDFSDEEQAGLNQWLEATLDEPDEVFMDEKTFADLPIFHFLKHIQDGENHFTYIASAYVTLDDQYPTFVIIHFPSRDPKVIKAFKIGDVVFDEKIQKVQVGAVEGDGLSEGDPLAAGLYLSMVKLRSEKDIAEDEFAKFAELREDAIENADEIWRKVDSLGNVLVTFIKEYPDHESGDLSYIVITQEDEGSNVHSLLYSFPTIDKSLADRYRQGENLQAEEVSQESSH